MDYILSFTILTIIFILGYKCDILSHLVYNNERQVFIQTQLKDEESMRNCLFAVSETSTNADRRTVADDLMLNEIWSTEDKNKAHQLIIDEFDDKLNETLS